MPELKKLILGDHGNPNRELERLFGAGPDEKAALNAAVAWGRDIVDSAGVSPEQELLTIKTLREAEPRLSLRPAVHLAKLLAS